MHDSRHVQGPDAPAAALAGLGLIVADGALAASEGLARLARGPHLLCHGTFLCERLGLAARATRPEIRAARQQRHFDVAELFAFVCPARFATPTPAGLARALALEPAASDLETLTAIAQDLLGRLGNRHYPNPRETAEVANFLARAKWPWAPAVLAALLAANPRLDVGSFATGLSVWDRIEEWEEDGGRPPGRQDSVSPEEAETFLAEILGPGAERRPAQMGYAAAATRAFAPREKREENAILLAEAGTGLGKTLGYLAPSYLWAKRNNAPVWVSTYTKNLQRQIDQETARLVEEPEERRSRIVIRKGRENYVCLLNLQEAFGRLTAGDGQGALLAALIARWARHSRDGDMVGGDFPSWLFTLFADTGLDGEQRSPSPASLGLTDRRGECIYAACPHYRRCFIERVGRMARRADIVIANHALVLHQAAVDQALGVATTSEEEAAPGGLKRIVFDEGHHLFDAADGAFSGHLTALETAELRRWLRGPENERRRGRGLADRIGELLAESEEGEKLLAATLRAALALPGPGWLRRVQAGQPEGAAEHFLALVR
ncbi:MAG: ATP-dependent DNA helicase, partial [Alphaproteobacteria bacterium]|nr:ATP-dependent DNA helicase [Alphaproteobacteria bacterium]